MNYSPWADAYVLRFLASYSVVAEEHHDRIGEMVTQTIRALEGTQKPGGGWSYYITHVLSEDSKPTNQSISFMTAAVLISLLETKEAGFEVPTQVTDKATDCLERMRNSNETFTYFLWHDNEDNGRLAGEEGAAGRGPLCSLALAMADRSKPDEVAKSLDLFFKYSDLYSRERGKSLMHAAPGSQGSHYLMFDYAWAASAIDSLPDDQKTKYQKGMLELILTSRSKKGSYLDNPINGWHYGTAMALEAIELLKN